MLRYTPLMVLFFGLLGVRLCAQTAAFSKPISVTSDFEEMGINDYVLKSRRFTLAELPTTNLRGYFREHFEANQDKFAIYLGTAWERETGWVYAELVNQTTTTQQLTLAVQNNIKCDGITAYYVVADTLQRTYEVKRTTPIADRPYSSSYFAMPITLPPLDTLYVLLESSRRVGFNELNLSLKQERVYKSQMWTNVIKSLFLMLFGFITSLLLLTLGFIYNGKILLYLGFYLLSLACSFMIILSFQDQFSYPPWLALDASSMIQFMPSITNMVTFLVLFQLRRRWSQTPLGPVGYFYWFQIAANGVNSFLLLFTTSFDSYVTNSLQILTVLAIFSAFFEIWMFSYHTKRYYFLAAAVVGLGISLGESLYRLFISTDYPFIPLVNFTLAPTAILLLAIGGINEVRYELISKERLENMLVRERSQLDEVRKEEIERIGRDLHDGIGNSLASILGYLSLKEIRREKIQGLLIDLIQEVRIISHRLVKGGSVPLSLRLNTLVEGFNEFSTTNFRFFDYSSGELAKLEPFRQDNLYYMVQELLNNTLKHAHATEVTLQVFVSEDGLMITVDDDGVGMRNPDENSWGIGLKNTHKRAKLSDFKFYIDSSATGTNTIIEINQ